MDIYIQLWQPVMDTRNKIIDSHDANSNMAIQISIMDIYHSVMDIGTNVHHFTPVCSKDSAVRIYPNTIFGVFQLMDHFCLQICTTKIV